MSMDMETVTCERPKIKRGHCPTPRALGPFPVPHKKYSRFLGPWGLKGLDKVGDIVCPGDSQYPRFSRTMFAGHIDRMLETMTEHDREGVAFLLALFGLMPSFFVRGVLALSERNKKFPDLLGAPLRMIQIGIKGLIFTLYYSKLEEPQGLGEKIHEKLGWETSVAPLKEDQECSMNREVASKNLENPTASDVDRIYDDARHAQKEIKRLSVKERLGHISALRELILERQEQIIDRIQKDTRKSRSDALMSEIFPVLDHLAFLEQSAVKALRDEKVKTPLALMGKKSRIFYEPLGTILVISPWNYPFYQAIVPLTTAFVAGSAGIYKPSEYTPLKGLVEELLQDAGLRANWAQVVYGDGAVGAELIKRRPDKIFFTGSVRTGKKIMEEASKLLIPVELELGGKDPMLIFEDTNITRAAAGAAWGMLTNAGQSCTSVERIYVQETIYQKFKEALLKELSRVKVAIDADGDADMGHMTAPMQIEIVRGHVEDAKAKGATILTGGEWDGTSERIPPILVEKAGPGTLIHDEETFGPVAVIAPFMDEAHAVELANSSPYGLSASVWSADKERAQRVARAIHTGNVSVNNVMLSEGNHYLPFGGVKDSGIGRYKGVSGLRGFCNQKSVLIDSDSKKIEANWYPYTKEKYTLFSLMTKNLFTRGLKAFALFAWYGLKLESLSEKSHKTGRS